MLGYWRPREQFQCWQEEKLLSFLHEYEKLIRFYAYILEKVYIINLDGLLPLVFDGYSFTGAPGKNQQEIFRALGDDPLKRRNYFFCGKTEGSSLSSCCLWF